MLRWADPSILLKVYAHSRMDKRMEAQAKRTASEPTLTKIYDVYMTPDGRVEGKEDDLVESLERDAEVLDRLRSPKSGRRSDMLPNKLRP